MAFVQRDEAGAITAVSRQRTATCAEEVAGDDADLQRFLGGLASGRNELDESDRDLVRVLEDLVDLLVAKGVILFTELPPTAQRKIMARQRLRSELGAALDLLDDD